jgi:integrase|tara:strand:+ start:1457 stop:2455 length:999 start_codon:yes stop_codon:yes gene_type:complete
MYIRKRLGKYFVEIKRRGHKSIYKTFNQKSDAIKWGRSVELQLDQSRYRDTSNASKTTLLSVMERHLKERLRVVREPNKEQSRFNVIKKHDIVKRSLSSLSPQIFARYRDERIDDGLSNSTICRELSFMSIAIKKAIRFYNCWLPEHPIPNDIKPKENPPRNRRLEEGEFDKLMEHCKTKRNSYWCSMIEFAIETAMRLNEQLTLKWDQVDLKKMMITILAEHSKTGVERKIPLTPRAIEILNEIPRHIKGRVFPVSLNNFQRAWRSITRNAEIKNLHWHDLRREACSRLMERGLSISEVQMFTGHKTLSLMLQTYSSHNPSVVAKKLNSVQ